MFAGLMSRWIMSCACAADSPRAISPGCCGGASQSNSTGAHVAGPGCDTANDSTFDGKAEEVGAESNSSLFPPQLSLSPRMGASAYKLNPVHLRRGRGPLLGRRA